MSTPDESQFLPLRRSVADRRISEGFIVEAASGLPRWRTERGSHTSTLLTAAHSYQRCARAHPLGWDNSRIDLPMTRCGNPTTRCGNPTLALRAPHLEHLERAREDPDPARVPRPPRHGAVDQDDEDPG